MDTAADALGDAVVTGLRTTWRQVVDAVISGREATTIGGWLAIKLVACPTCASQRGFYCLSVYGQREQTNGVHVARRNAAAEYLSEAIREPLAVPE